MDADAERVKAIVEEVTQAVQVDALDEAALKSLGLRNFEAVVVAIGHEIKASILVTVLLKEMGVPKILAKAADELHGKVLQKVGADIVVFPERDMESPGAYHTLAKHHRRDPALHRLQHLRPAGPIPFPRPQPQGPAAPPALRDDHPRRSSGRGHRHLPGGHLRDGARRHPGRPRPARHSRTVGRLTPAAVVPLDVLPPVLPWRVSPPSLDISLTWRPSFLTPSWVERRDPGAYRLHSGAAKGGDDHGSNTDIRGNVSYRPATCGPEGHPGRPSDMRHDT